MLSKKVLLSQIADELEVSKTTVSRALSGVGRVGAKTQRRIVEYINKEGYKFKANAMALRKEAGEGVIDQLENKKLSRAAIEKLN